MKTAFLIPIILYSFCNPDTGNDSDDSDSDGSTTSGDLTDGVTGPTTGVDVVTTTEAPTTGAPCQVGAAGCECTPGGACDDGLACADGLCVDHCDMGSLGCECTPGGACDPGLSCDAGTCVEGFSPPCPDGQQADDCCGDGVLDEFEDCDKGVNWNDDAGECTTQCRLASCGDGLVRTGVEACDGDKDCTSECTLKSCGNGVIDDPREWCEPASDDDPECTHLCGDARKIIFVSSEHYRGGEIGGLEGGDQKCQHLADAEGLAGTFKVWLATDKSDAPLVRFSWSDVPYVDVNGKVIAETWTEIYSHGGNQAPIITEQGFAASPAELTWPTPDTNLVAWSSALGGPGGPAVDPNTCDSWLNTNTAGSAAIIDPSPGVSPGKFSASWGNAECWLHAPIICVEQ